MGLFRKGKIGIIAKFHRTDRAPDNFLKQGVADASLEANGVCLQNPEVFSLPRFYTSAF